MQQAVEKESRKYKFTSEWGESYTKNSAELINLHFTWAISSQSERSYYLDIQPTVGMVCNQKLLRNIRKLGIYIKINCNLGSKWVEIIGGLLGYGIVWFYGSAEQTSRV